MTVMVYNTLTRKKEELKPHEEKKINLFVCGPTVYDLPHIGHARTYIFFDAFAKFLRKEGYQVFYLQNITDIDDKIIKRAKEEKSSPSGLAKKFEEIYFEDMSKLRVSAVSRYARATEYIEEIIKQTKMLLEEGFAYKTDDGIYYDISKFKEYGKLSGRDVAQAEDGVSRIDESIKKHNKGDFCLWKYSSPEEPQWESPWGKGRPGWHIEDTAIAEKFFGPQYDIHGGAKDLIFPHHEAEIAQMEAISGKKPFVRYWLHTGFLTVKGDKMSKSLGNFITIREFLEKYSPHPERILRFLALRSHYRSPIDYNEETVVQIKSTLQKIDELVNKLEELSEKAEKPQKNPLSDEARESFTRILRDDFDTPSFFASFFSFVSRINNAISKGDISPEEALEILNLWKEYDEIFSLFISPKEKRMVQISRSERSIELEGIDTEEKKAQELAEKRKKHRENKEFEKADQLREEIEKLGFIIEDAGINYKLKKRT